jgi:hypothetical protein
MGQSREHKGVVVLLLRVFILKSHDFETLTTHLASVDWTFPYKVVHLLMSVGVVFHTWSSTDNDSPRAVRSKDQSWVVNSSELSVNYRLHFVPLVKLY